MVQRPRLTYVFDVQLILWKQISGNDYRYEHIEFFLPLQECIDEQVISRFSIF